MPEHKKSIPVRVIVTGIYAIGIAITVFLAIKCFVPATAEPSPDAMIPFTDNERAFITMALGFPLMLGSAISVIWAHGLRKSQHPRRNPFLALIPAVIDGIPFVAVAVILLIMLAEGFLDVLLNR